MAHERPVFSIFFGFPKGRPMVFGHIVDSDKNTGDNGGDIIVRPFYCDIDKDKKGVKNTHSPWRGIRAKETTVRIENPLVQLKKLDGTIDGLPATSTWIYVDPENRTIHDMFDFQDQQRFTELHEELERIRGENERLRQDLNDISTNPEKYGLKIAQHTGHLKVAQSGVKPTITGSVFRPELNKSQTEEND